MHNTRRLRRVDPPAEIVAAEADHRNLQARATDAPTR
jgi:hypothetical protein